MSINPTGDETHATVQTLDDIVALFPELTLTTFVVDNDVIVALPRLIRANALLDLIAPLGFDPSPVFLHDEDCDGDCGI